MKQTFFKTFALAVAIFATPAVAMAAITEWGNSETTSWTAPTSSKYDHGSTVTLSGVVITLGTTVDTGIQWEGKTGSNNGIVPGTMPNTDGSASTLITSFDDKAPYGTLPTRGGFLKIVPSEDGRITINGLPSSQKSQKLVFVTCNKEDSSIESVSLADYDSKITSWNYSVDASHVYYFFQLAYSGQLAGYRFTLRGLSFRPSMSAAKSALADALDAAKAKLDSYANCTGEGPFMVTTASYSSLNSAYTTAKAAYDKDDYEDLDAADAAYAAQTTALNSVALVLNQPDANKCYYIKYGTLYLNLNSDTKWADAKYTQYMPVLSSQPYALKFEAKDDTENGYYIKNADASVYIYKQSADNYATAIGNKNASHYFLPDPVSGGQIKFRSSWKDDYYFAGSNPIAGSVLGVSSSNIRSFTVTEASELSATASVTSALWGTFVAPFDVNFTETGITAYTVALNDGKDAIVTTEVEDGAVPANTPVLIHAASATSHEFTGYSSAYYTGQPTVGALTGTLASGTSAPAGSYLLQKRDAGVGFYYLESAAAINQYRAWLTVPAETPVKAFVLNDQLTDAINAIVSQGDSTAEYFSVGGTRLSQPTRGINIVRTADGKTKKIIVK